MAAEATPGPSTSGSTMGKKTDKLARLRELQMKRNEARKLNHQEVVEEDRRNKLPENFEAKKRRLEWEEEEDQRKKECQAKGEDYERVKLLNIGATDAEKWERAKQRKKNPDQGFADYEQASYRQYQRLTKQLKSDMTEYEREKEKMGDAFYPTLNTLGVIEHKDSKKAVDRMVDDLEKQIEKRSKYSRRRVHDEEKDIDFINERNMKFNKKLERFYGKYTAEIKQNLERGTAV